MQRLYVGSNLAAVRARICRSVVSQLSEKGRKIPEHWVAGSSVGLVGQVRQGNSEDELDQMQREVDEIVRETLNFYDDGAIEEGDLSAFSLALEQFHHAVTNRKAEDYGFWEIRPVWFGSQAAPWEQYFVKFVARSPTQEED